MFDIQWTCISDQPYGGMSISINSNITLYTSNLNVQFPIEYPNYGINAFAISKDHSGLRLGSAHLETINTQYAHLWFGQLVTTGSYVQGDANNWTISLGK